MPQSELSTCFRAWRESVARGDPLVLGLVESEVLPMREVAGWLNQPTPCVFHGVYDELKLTPYVIRAQSK